MRIMENHIKSGKFLLEEKEKLKASEVAKLLFDTGLSGTGQTEKLIDLANNSFYFGASVGYHKKRSEKMKELALTKEEQQILRTLKQRPEICDLLKRVNSLPEEEQPAVIESCIKLLTGAATAKELIEEYWTRKAERHKQQAEIVTQ